jgi:hypothetical protein
MNEIKEIETDPEHDCTKLDLLLINNGWNDKNEILIVSIGENAAAYKWMHEKSNSKYASYDNLLSLIIIIFNTILTTQTFITVESNAIEISKKIFIYIVTLLAVVNNFLKYKELSINHLNAIGDFSELYHDIQQQMCMYRKDRDNASRYIKSIIKTYDSLIVSCPDIPDSILNEFKKKFKNSDIEMPDISDRIQKIEIITQPSNVFNVNSTNSVNEFSENVPKETFIKNSLKIDGDLTENDIPLLLMKKKALNATSDYEYNRLFRNDN